jgi:hypothetical protein
MAQDIATLQAAELSPLTRAASARALQKQKDAAPRTRSPPSAPRRLQHRRRRASEGSSLEVGGLFGFVLPNELTTTIGCYIVYRRLTVEEPVQGEGVPLACRVVSAIATYLGLVQLYRRQIHFVSPRCCFLPRGVISATC